MWLVRYKWENIERKKWEEEFRKYEENCKKLLEKYRNKKNEMKEKAFCMKEKLLPELHKFTDCVRPFTKDGYLRYQIEDILEKEELL